MCFKMGKKGKKLHFLGQMQQKVGIIILNKWVHSRIKEPTKWVHNVYCLFKFTNRNTLIWKFTFLDALPLLAKLQWSKFMKIHKNSKVFFYFWNNVDYILFLELQNMNVFFVILSSPNVLTFIVFFNIFYEKSIMS
jgi:hypothetical protein